MKQSRSLRFGVVNGQLGLATGKYIDRREKEGLEVIPETRTGWVVGVGR